MAKQSTISQNKIKLSAYEKSIEDSIDYSKLKKPASSDQRKIKMAAQQTLNDLKSARANIRMNEGDMKMLRSMAEKAGMPYQTLIAHVLHLYITDQLINLTDLRKMSEAGLLKKIS